MRFVLKDFYQELSLNEPSKGITKDELYEATVSDINIRTIVEKNTHILRGGNKKDDDISASLNNLIYSGQQYVYFFNLVKENKGYSYHKLRDL